MCQALREYYDVVRPSDPSSLPDSPTTRTEIDRFQRIVVTARKTFGTKISLLSLVDEKRQFFKCEAGLGMYFPPSMMMSLTFRNVETDREITFCGHTILSNEPMVVLNAEKDWRLAENPLVTGWPYVRFYAGAPVLPLCTRV
jgi:GAF domain-containing protein